MTVTCVKIRYGVFNAYISRLLKIIFVGEEGKKDPLPNEMVQFKYQQSNDSHVGHEISQSSAQGSHILLQHSYLLS